MKAIIFGVLVFWVFALTISSCKSLSDSSLNELERQNRQDELCGVKRYNEREDKACGSIYLSKASSRCGVDSYKSKKSKACPGYVSFHEKREYGDKNSNPGCPKGYKPVHRENIYENKTSRSREGSGVSKKVHVRDMVVCHRAEVKKSCRRKEHGIAAYKTCRHSSHGLERYKACERPENGVAEYKKCEFYKNPTEAMAFAGLVERDIPMMRDNIVIHRGNFYAAARNERALGNFIKKYDEDPLYKEAVANLKLKFGSIFGLPYTATNYNSSDQDIKIETFKCVEGDTSGICRSAWGYQITYMWFTENISDLILVRDEMTKFKKMKIVEAVNAIIEHLQKPISTSEAEQKSKEVGK